MTGREFIRRARKIGNERGIAVSTDEKRGKGSHSVLFYGHRKTIVKDRRKELGPGLMSKMIRDLGLDWSDFRQ